MKIIDHGLDRITRETQRLAGLEIAVGILEKDIDEQYPNGMTLGEVAAFNEYGTATAPSRSFIGDSADAYREKAADAMQEKERQVVDGALSPESAADKLGEWLHGRINTHIDQKKNWADNAASTIKRKGRDDPLKDTKKLYNAIDYEVRKK